MYLGYDLIKTKIFFLKTKDEFLGMFYVDLNANIPYESAEQPLQTKDYSLLKRRLVAFDS
jgi:hypothetical protein